MCGRFTITTDRVDSILKQFRADVAPGFEGYQPRYNAAPGQKVPALVAKEDGKRYLTNVFWGFVPPWGEKNDGGKITMQANIRDDTIQKNKFFKDRLLNNRCVFVADGFYEWQKPEEFRNLERGAKLPRGVQKTPYRITMQNLQPFALAGLWRTFESDGEKVISSAIITTGPNKLMLPIHDRMPVVLSDADLDAWLDPSIKDFDTLYPLLDPYSEKQMNAYPVTQAVNSSRIDSPACIEPAA